MLSKSFFCTKITLQPKLSVPVRGLQDDDGHSDLDLLQSLRFDAAEHSSQGYRCSSRYEWYQTSSDVVVDIMIPNVKKEDITVKFTEGKVYNIIMCNVIGIYYT